MSEDTAQVSAPVAAPADPVAAAAAAFRQDREPEAPAVQRDDKGRFASTQEPVVEPEQEIEAEEAETEIVEEAEAEYDEEQEAVEEAAEEAQPEAVDMPASWSKEDAELWTSLPPETQAKIAEREGQRDTALNSKFQEIANARKAIEGQLAEANTNRDKYGEAIDQVLALARPVKPDPRQYGLGTSDYRRDAYDYAVLQYEQQIETIQHLQQQRESITAQQQEEAERAEKAAYEEIEAKARPMLLQAVPEISDPQKQAQALGEIVEYAVSQGIPEHVFSDPENAKRITSAELLMAWKAKEYDRLQASKARVAPKAQPKPKSPPLRPGVATPRATQKQMALKKDMERLEKTGSVEAGAAIFRHFR